jgi:hypothetical protein
VQLLLLLCTLLCRLGCCAAPGAPAHGCSPGTCGCVLLLCLLPCCLLLHWLVLLLQLLLLLLL